MSGDGKCYDNGTKRVPGRGKGDHIRALLEPGEGVITTKGMAKPGMREAVRRINRETRDSR